MKQFTIKPERTYARIPVVLSVLLLCGAGLESRKFRAPPDTTPYLKRVRDLANSDAGIPNKIGDWVGHDMPVAQSAVALLRPNVIISRDYFNPTTGKRVELLFVHCSDARDTVGHYPPICYPSQGYSTELTEPKTWQLPHMAIHGTEYNFVRNVFDSDGKLWVDDFFVLPGTGTAPDRTPVIAAASDLQRRFYGVGQVQLVFTYPCTEQEREQAFVELFTPLEGLFQSILTVKPNAGISLSTPTVSPAGVKEANP